MQGKEANYYTKLYKTQDKILEIVARENLGLYLTGGTALQRFHFVLIDIVMILWQTSKI